MQFAIQQTSRKAGAHLDPASICEDRQYNTRQCATCSSKTDLSGALRVEIRSERWGRRLTGDAQHRHDRWEQNAATKNWRLVAPLLRLLSSCTLRLYGSAHGKGARKVCMFAYMLKLNCCHRCTTWRKRADGCGRDTISLIASGEKRCQPTTCSACARSITTESTLSRHTTRARSTQQLNGTEPTDGTSAS